MTRKLQRMKYIVGIIRKGMMRQAIGGRFVTKPEIVAGLAEIDPRFGEFCCCKKTVQRDIAELNDLYHAQIEFDPSCGGYFLLDESWSFDPLPFSRDEQYSIYLAILGMLADTPKDPLFNALHNNVVRRKFEDLRREFEAMYGFSPPQPSIGRVETREPRFADPVQKRAPVVSTGGMNGSCQTVITRQRSAA